MIGKTNWTRYLHAIRKKEIDLVFSLLSQDNFSSGLEIGAGDGFQTTLLSPHVKKLISSDLNFKRIKIKVPGVEYKEIDADQIEGVFPPETFSLIFSSNVLEHVRDPLKVLKSTREMLKDDGYAVHIVPNRWIKIFYLLFFYPNLLLLALDRISGKFEGRKIFQGEKIDLENNINKKKTNRWKKLLIPTPHGNFPDHWTEFKVFGMRRWEQMFIEAGYSIVSCTKGPVFSGYGFGFNSSKLLRYTDISSEHIFILKKMSKFEFDTWAYTNSYLSRGSFYERRKFVKDWLKKDKNAKAFFQDFMRDVGDPQGKKVLDVGFGNGIIMEEFIRGGADAYGLETEQKLLKVAKLKNLFVYDGRKLPFQDAMFDYCYSTSVLEHMSYPQEVLREIARVLKPGGKFYLSFPNKYAPKESHTGLWFISWLPRPITQKILKWSGSSPLEDWNLHFISYFSLKKMLRGSGLRIIYNVESSSRVKGFVKKILELFGIHFGILLKTFIMVLEKSPDHKL